nr:amidase [Ornithinimicrobium cryptoxanthini]
MDLDPPVVAEGAEGPFSGVPFLLKDLGQYVAGQACSDGSRSLVGLPRSETGTAVQRWLDSGLVIFGRTNTPEFGAKGVTEPAVYGPARNPWNTDHTPGGSSGGSAAAVAAGIVPCAAASDGGGSIRIPASACGLFGLKTSRGLVPSGPAQSESLDGIATNGVISRSVRDTAGMLDVLVGPAPESPYPIAAPSTAYSDEVGQDPGRLRIALTTASSINADPHLEAIAAVRSTAELLSELGHEVVELEQPPFDDAALAREFLTIWFAYAAYQLDLAKQASGADDSQFEPDTLTMAALGRATKPMELIQALENRQVHIRRLVAFHETHDLLLTPTTATPPPRIGAFDLPPRQQVLQARLIKVKGTGLLRFTSLIDQIIGANHSWVPYTQLANMTGRPAMSVPLHWTPDDLPIGSQFVGRLGSEGLLLRLASQLEAARPWAGRRPQLSPAADRPTGPGTVEG